MEGIDEWEAGWIPAKPGAGAWEKRVLAEPGAEERVREAQERLERAVHEVRALEQADRARYEAEERGSLGRPTRDVNGFWEYGVWDRTQGHIHRHHNREAALRYLEELTYPEIQPGVLGDHPRYILVRRWLGGWEAGD